MSMRRWPRLKQHGITIWRLRERLDLDLEEFSEAGFIELIEDDDRTDIAKVGAALHLIQRRREIATLARIAAVLEWPYARVRTALSALEERKTVKRTRIPNPYPPHAYALDKSQKAPLAAEDFVSACDASDPRDDPAPQTPIAPESLASREAADRVIKAIKLERYDKREAP